MELPEGMTITNIRRGKGSRKNLVYAHLMDSNGNLVISATLDYIYNALTDPERIWNSEPEILEDKPAFY